jgi:hypothetical protein
MGLSSKRGFFRGCSYPRSIWRVSELTWPDRVLECVSVNVENLANLSWKVVCLPGSANWLFFFDFFPLSLEEDDAMAVVMRATKSGGLLLVAQSELTQQELEQLGTTTPLLAQKCSVSVIAANMVSNAGFVRP